MTRRPDPIGCTPAPPPSSAATRTAARAAFRADIATGTCHSGDRQRLAQKPEPRVRHGFN